MFKTKEIGNISVITETNPSFREGEVTGGFLDFKLKEHIKTYGHKGLTETLAYMQWQVYQMLREVNAEHFDEIAKKR